MNQRASQRTRTKSQTVAVDDFLDSIQSMIETGRIAQMSESILKAELIAKVQSYSEEVPFLQGEVSDAFLRVCDLIIDGDLSRLPLGALKVYLTLLAYGASEESQIDAAGRLQALADIHDASELKHALQNLQSLGHIESVSNPVLKKKQPHPKKTLEERADRLFAIA